MKPNLVAEAKTQVCKALKHLKYSFEKAKVLPIDRFESLSEPDLEVLESFASRFARTSDIVIQKYLRAKIVEKDPGFRGTLLDLLNEAEKVGLIESAKVWYSIRELRNVAAHEYEAKDIIALYKQLFQLAPVIIQIEQGL